MQKFLKAFEERVKSFGREKRGAVGKVIVTSVIGAVIAAVLIANLAPSVFGNLGNATLFSSAPSWVSPTLSIIAGAGFIYLLWEAMVGNR